MSSFRKWLDRLPYYWFLILCSVTAFFVVNYFFCPRFVLWQGLNIPPSQFNPEVNRAVDTLRLLHDPFEKITHESNGAIQWRLFFPLVGHYLGFPDWLLLCVAPLGCLVLTALMAHLAWRETHDRLLAAEVAILLTTTSWFFVSMGWLCYFDSWYVLGLVLATFFRSRKVLIATSLLVPWIDERFILAMPVTLLARWIYFRSQKDYTVRRWLEDGAIVFLTALPWLIFRIYGIQTGADPSEAIVHFGHTFEFANFGSTLAWGIWHGFRGIWFYVFLLLVLLWKQWDWKYTLGLVSVVIVVFGITIVLSGDLSRSISMFFPLAVLGIFYGYRLNKPLVERSLPLILAFNLAAPASHIITSFDEPILYLPFRWLEYQKPPAEVNPYAYNNESRELFKAGKIQEALEMNGFALRLKPDYAEALFNRAYLHVQMRQPAAAFEFLERSLKINPQYPEAYYLRGILRQESKDIAKANADFLLALQYAPKGWQYEEDARKRLNAGQTLFK